MTELPKWLDEQWLKRFRKKVASWYSGQSRPLPWRETADPYRIWVSEIMLQQTTVATVIPYYKRFFEGFATVQELAAADEEAVLREWEGLGYYSRARNLQRAAKMIVEDRNGAFPADVDDWQSLPGIGRYTAGAIVSFAYGEPAPIVEANTLRLYSRLLGYEGDPKSSAGQKLLWSFAETIVPEQEPGPFNQAMMDLGSQVCTPASPRCSECPVSSCCAAFKDNLQEQIPWRSPKPELTELCDATVAVRGPQGKYLLRRRTAEEWWSGLWDFPRFPIVDPPATRTARIADASLLRIPQDFQELTGLEIESPVWLKRVQHGVTRYRIQLHCFSSSLIGGRLNDRAEYAWVSSPELEEYPLPTTGRKFARLLNTQRDSLF